jgi:hypothetical protein
VGADHSGRTVQSMNFLHPLKHWDRGFESTLKKEETCFFDASVVFQPTIRRYIPEDRILLDYRCENLSSFLRNMLHHAVANPLVGFSQSVFIYLSASDNISRRELIMLSVFHDGFYGL